MWVHMIHCSIATGNIINIFLIHDLWLYTSLLSTRITLIYEWTHGSSRSLAKTSVHLSISSHWGCKNRSAQTWNRDSCTFDGRLLMFTHLHGWTWLYDASHDALVLELEHKLYPWLHKTHKCMERINVKFTEHQIKRFGFASIYVNTVYLILPFKISF